MWGTMLIVQVESRKVGRNLGGRVEFRRGGWSSGEVVGVQEGRGEFKKGGWSLEAWWCSGRGNRVQERWMEFMSADRSFRRGGWSSRGAA
jgi:hypothetical protein